MVAERVLFNSKHSWTIQSTSDDTARAAATRVPKETACQRRSGQVDIVRLARAKGSFFVPSEKLMAELTESSGLIPFPTNPILLPNFFFKKKYF